jgi:hypothetical protein
MRVTRSQAQDCWRCQDSPRALQGVWPCQHLDLELLASRTERTQCRRVLPPYHGPSSWWPQETSTASMGPFCISLPHRSQQQWMVMPCAICSLLPHLPPK